MLTFPENFIQSGLVNRDSMLVFSMSDCRDVKAGGSQTINPMSAIIKMVTYTAEVELPLSRFGSLMVPFCPRLSKLKWEHLFFKKKSHLMFQTFECPLTVFLEKVPELDLNKIKRIQFEFDKDSDGHIAIDNIGFTNPPPQ